MAGAFARSLVVSVSVAALVSGCSGASHAPQAAASTESKPPGKVAVSGEFDLVAVNGSDINVLLPQGGGDGKPCAGDRGYDDIQQGASVTMRDEKGTLVGSGQLGEGSLDVSTQPYLCKFYWNMSDVPSGHSFYQVEVSHRGAQTLKESDLDNLVTARLG